MLILAGMFSLGLDSRCATGNGPLKKSYCAGTVGSGSGNSP